jgi:hypothetical protein
MIHRHCQSSAAKIFFLVCQSDKKCQVELKQNKQKLEQRQTMPAYFLADKLARKI